MGKQLNLTSSADMLKRIEHLQPGTKAAWGKLTVTGMMCHYTTVTNEILNARPTNKKPTGKQIIIKTIGLYFMHQFPRGVKSSDKYVKQDGETLDFEQEKENLIRIVKFAAAYNEPIHGEHPFFGPMVTKEWKRFLYKHLDHHLRQFGV